MPEEDTSANILKLENGSARASLLVEQGFNCFQLSSRSRQLIWAPAGHALGNCHPACGGVPILYPFPGRIAGGQLDWAGNTYTLDVGDGQGNAIHGLAYDRPWRVTESSANMAAAAFRLSRDAPDRLAQWPSDFEIKATYRLFPQGLRCDINVQNVGDRSMPSGFGIHPYFVLPAGEDTVIRIPVTQQWELEQLLPTGDCSPASHMYQNGKRMSELQLDAVFSGLTPALRASDEAVRFEAVLGNNSGDSQTLLAFGQPFRELVVYTPGDRKSICIEPLSCLPSAIELGSRVGWKTLMPGETEGFWFEILDVA